MSLEKILLLSCRSPFLDDDKIYCPMGNLYLKSYLETYSNVEVTLGDDNYDLTNTSRFTDFDAIGVSIMTPQREEATKIVRAIKANHPWIKMIAGGPHVKHYLSDVEKEPWDYIVPQDGERALTHIMSGNAEEQVVRSMLTRQEILLQPRPDRSSDNAKEIIQSYHYKLQGRPATTMMTGRGCPEKCTFCEDAMTNIRWSSLDNLKDEMDDVVKLGYQGVYIFDDLFAIAEKKVTPICEELKKRDLTFRCNGQVRYFTREGESFAKMLSKNGCVEIAFGFESGSQKILDNIQKRTKVEDNYRSVEYAKDHGINVKGFMMLGLPGETEETIEQTEAFIRDAGMDDFQLSIYFPYKGTQIRDSIDAGQNETDISLTGEGLGAYGQKGGSTEAVVRVGDFSSEDLLRERDRIVNTYKPKAHVEKWKDKFRDTHLKDKECM